MPTAQRRFLILACAAEKSTKRPFCSGPTRCRRNQLAPGYDSGGHPQSQVSLRWMGGTRRGGNTLRHTNDLLKELPLLRPGRLEKAVHVYHLYVIQMENRDRVRELLRAQGVATGIHYPIPCRGGLCASGLSPWGLSCDRAGGGAGSLTAHVCRDESAPEGTCGLGLTPGGDLILGDSMSATR